MSLLQKTELKSFCMCAFSAPEELQSIIQEVKYRSGLQSAKLIRQLRRRDRLCHKLQKNYDIITACLQAVSQKRRKNTQFFLYFTHKKQPYNISRRVKSFVRCFKVAGLCPSRHITCSMKITLQFT